MEVILLICIAILSIIQSLFGVGLLLFGTPLFIIYGLSYEETLSYLLPASISLSLSQMLEYKNVELENNYRQNFFKWCLPVLALTMLLAINLKMSINIKPIMAVFLLFISLIRLNQSWLSHLQILLSKNLKIALCLMGFIHGLTNLGGAILTPLASSLYRTKTKTVAAISFDYFFMASLQLLILMLTYKFHLSYIMMFSPVVSVVSRKILGQRAFTKTTNERFHLLLNVFLILNSIILWMTA